MTRYVCGPAAKVELEFWGINHRNLSCRHLTNFPKMQYIRGNHKLDNPVILEIQGIYRFYMNVFEHAYFQ